MKIFKRLSKLTLALLGSGLILMGCDMNAADSSSSAPHVHVFGKNTYPCEDRTCLECGAKIAATEAHDDKLTRVVDATCEERGYSVYRCSRCDNVTNGSYVAALGHDYKIGATVAATCDHVGYTEFDCSRCSSSYKEYVPAGEHSFDESKTVVVAATCTNYGKTTKHCVTCGKDYVVSYSDPLGHEPTAGSDKVVAPTCVKNGYTSHVCSRCNETYIDSIVAKLSHNFVTINQFEATCEHPSYNECACLECGLTKFEGGSEGKKAHSFDDSGVCSSCHKSYLSANFFSFSKGDKVIPYLEDSYYDHLMHSEESEESIVGKVSSDDVSYLISKGARAIVLQLGSYENEERSFSFEFGSKTQNAKAICGDNFDFERLATFKITLTDEEGVPSSGILDNGVSFKIKHQKGEDETSEEAFYSFPMRFNLLTRYSEDDPSSYLTEGDANISYVDGKGYRLDYLKETTNNSFLAYIRKEKMQAEKDKGMDKVTITFTTSFEGYTYSGNEYQCSYDIYAYKFINAEKSERGRLGTAWIQTGTKGTGDTYSHTFSGLQDMDFSQSGLEMNFSTCDVFAKFVGHVYIESIAFEASV